MISQLASEVLQLKSNPTPPATAADNDSLSPLAPETVSLPPQIVPTPLPLPPVVPAGEPLHYDSLPRPKKYTVKLESFSGQGASFDSFLEKYEEHSPYYK